MIFLIYERTIIWKRNVSWIGINYKYICVVLYKNLGFPGSSTGKESTCDAGDPGSIPGLGRSPWEGIGYPLQYSWASLMAHMIKNLPAIWETRVRSPGWEDPLEKGIAIHSSILAWKIRMDRGAWQAIVHKVAKSQTRLNGQAQHSTTYKDLSFD